MDMNKKEHLSRSTFQMSLVPFEASEQKKTGGGLKSIVKEKEREGGIAWIYLLYQVNYFKN